MESEDKEEPDPQPHQATLPDQEPTDAVAALVSKLESGQLTDQEQIELGRLMEQRGLVVTATRHESFSGPIPPAELLNQYDPEVQRAIVQMAQDEQSHTHSMQTHSLQGAINKDRRGQWLGCLIAVSGLAAAAYIAPHSPVAAGLIGAIDLFGMVALFVAPRILEKRRQSTRDE